MNTLRHADGDSICNEDTQGITSYTYHMPAVWLNAKEKTQIPALTESKRIQHQ